MSTQRKAIVGAFVVGGTLLFAVALFLIGNRRLLFQPQIEIGTTFGKVTGLQLGTQVRVEGFNAGEVLEIRIPSQPSEQFLVRMRLREDLRPLVRADSVAAIQTDGIVGSAFIQIARGSDGAPMVEHGAVLRGTDPVELADLIEEGRDTFRREIKAEISYDIELRDLQDVITESLLEEVITKIRLEAFYINQLLPRIVEEQDARLRNDFLSNSGLDRFQVEELESEYFEMRAFPPQLLESIQRPIVA